MTKEDSQADRVADIGRERQHIARDFRRLSRRFVDHSRHAEKPHHLALNVESSAVQAGRLFVNAVDLSAFPESARETNCDWWDRREGRIPGGSLTVLGLAGSDPSLREKVLAAAIRPFDVGQYARCWTYTVGSWLIPAFPHRFRLGAVSWDWPTILTDKEGFAIGKDGKRIMGRWYFKGKPVPKDFEFPKGRGNVTFVWRRMKPLVRCEDVYDDADWLAHLRIRAEVYSDACLVLSDLIGADRSDQKQPDELVTLSQVAPLTGLKKRTLERRLKDGRIPVPDFRGGGGKSHKWYWRTLRPVLSKLCNRLLPDRFPGSRII